MTKTQQLRHDVRTLLGNYAERHPEDFEAHMAFSAVIWLLAGRPGISAQEAVNYANSANVITTQFAAERPDSTTMAKAAKASQALLDAASARLPLSEEKAAELMAAAPDFGLWAQELEDVEPDSTIE